MSIISDDNTNFKKVDINAKNPVIKAETIECDRNFENCIRPKNFDSYIGQSALKYCFMAPRDSEKLHLQGLLQSKWGLK